MELDLKNVSPYSVLHWETFEKNPRAMYNLFEPQSCPSGKGKSFYSDKAFDMTSGRHLRKLSLFDLSVPDEAYCRNVRRTQQNCELKVDSVEELHMLAKDLLQMPILFRTQVKHTRTDHYLVMKVKKIWRDELAVLVNTQHLEIREVLSRRLSEAMQYMTEGKRFCLKIDFGQSVYKWYGETVDSGNMFSVGTNDSTPNHMCLYIHNYTTPVTCCIHPLVICCCFPFWMLFGGPCYLGHRKANCTDMEENIKKLPVTLLTGHHTVIFIDHHVDPSTRTTTSSSRELLLNINPLL